MVGSSTTQVLLVGARSGDPASRDALAERFRPALRRLAAARVPSGGLASLDVEDIVQETLLRAFIHVEEFQPRCDGAFLLYLRTILMNLIRDLARKEKRSPRPEPLGAEPPGRLPSPVEAAVGSEAWERYRRAVDGLTASQAEAVVLFVECGMDHEEIAAAIGSPSANAARMVVARGLKRVAELMRETGRDG